MANIILIKRSTGSIAPTTGQLAKGQLGFTEGNEVLFYRKDNGDVIEIGGSGLGTSSGFLSKTQNLSGLTDLAAARTNIGLGNVTNDAQVKKIASSTIGNVPSWDVTTGDRFEDGYGVETTLVGSTTALARADAVKVYVDGILSANDAMIFKGTLGSGGTFTSLPLTHGVGWTIKVITAGTYAGKVAEIGDMYISLVSRSGSGNLDTDWAVVQANIDGAVTGPASATDSHVAIFNGTSGKIIKSAGAVLGTGVLTLSTTGIATGNTTFGANQTTAGAFTVNVPGTNLGSSGTGGTRCITSSTGNDTSITFNAADVGAPSTSLNLSAGDGLTGGGDLTADRAFAVDSTVVRTSGNQTIAGVKTFSSTIVGTINNALTAANLNREVVAGNGLSGGGVLNANRTLTVGAGDGITVGATTVAVDSTVVRTSGDQTIAGVKTFSSTIVGTINNALTAANLNRQVIAGDGLSGGGILNADRTVAVDSTVVRTSGDQTIGGAKTFTSQVSAVSLNVCGKIIGGSATNTAAGANAAVLGGRNNTASGACSNVAGGCKI
jgi:hypothetical protein